MIKYNSHTRQITLAEAADEGFVIKGERFQRLYENYNGAIMSVINHRNFEDLCYWNGREWVYLTTKKK